MPYSLVGVDGNAFSVIGFVSKIMKKEHYSKAEIGEYQNRAMSGDYDNLLSVSTEILNEINNKC